MEEDQELKHVCKLCTKTFHCGRSLGGHMRSHMMTMSSAEAEVKLKKKKVSSVNGGSNSNSYMGFEANGGHGGYGLRENPKKTWRLSDSRDNTLQEEKVCKECGKGFQSWKALFGHMRCHSDREKVSNSLEDDSWTVANQKVVMDSQSDNEAAAPRRKRRSRRTRYKTTTTSSSLSFVNASSSVYEIEQEQEEVAMCLMMLSRDVGNWGGSNSVTEYSDNNSVVLEARSSCLDKPITGKEGKGFVCNGDETVKMKKLRNKKLESGVSNSNNVQSEKKTSEFVGSGSGFQRNGLKMVGSEVSVDGFLKDDEFKKPKQEDEARFGVSNVQFGKDSRNKNSVNCKKTLKHYSEVELQKDLIKEAGLSKDGSEFGKHNSTKISRNDGYDPEFGGHSSKMIRYDASDSEFCKEGQKKNRYECTTCNKIFHSYQALGGHRASHKKIKGCFASKIENSENSIETEFSPDPTCDSNLIKSCSNENLIDRDGAGSAETSYGSKKNKVHECPICLKVFASGQALGGHKRSHLVGASEVRGSQTIVIQQQLPEIHDLLDLNLPAPIEENISGHAELKPWWVGSNHKHEQLVGMISN